MVEHPLHENYNFVAKDSTWWGRFFSLPSQTLMQLYYTVEGNFRVVLFNNKGEILFDEDHTAITE